VQTLFNRGIGGESTKWRLTGLIGIALGDKLINQLLGQFPNLQLHLSCISSPKTASYNCIAYAASDVNRWWWPDAYGQYYWPERVLRTASLPAFQQAYESLGYQLCGNGRHEANLEKIAVYHLNRAPTHAARQLGDGRWTSKMGQWHDIVHTERCLTGSPEYGDIAFFMSRPFDQRQ